MIVYPDNWKKDYSDYADHDIEIQSIIGVLRSVLSHINTPHIGYSGGIDSTIMLDIMSNVYGCDIHTYTISSREDHPDVLFARMGSEFYNTNHHEFIVEPTKADTDRFNGDNVVRQFFENVSKHTDTIITCDGVDEFMCGYYDHQDMKQRTYEFYLGRLNPDHLIPLNNASKDVKVYLPYLDERLIHIYRNVPLAAKVDHNNRKKLMVKIAEYLDIPREIIERNKYGFCDAFRESDK